MSVATEFPPDVHIPAAARPRSLRVVSGRAEPVSARPMSYVAKRSPGPAAPAAAALGAGVVDLDRWRHQFVGAQAGDRRRNDAGLRTRPAEAFTGDASRAVDTAPASSPLRLTRLGVAVLAAVSVVIALAIVGFAWLSAAPAANAGLAESASVVTVRSGDSLWTIATQVAPNRDPRAEIIELRRLNQLTSDTVTPGQQLRVR